MESEQKAKALLVIYTFPPTGGAGVQRAVKFSKYLPLNGINTTVLTVKKILYHVYDESLLEDVHPSVDIIRTKSWDPLRLGYAVKELIGGRKGEKKAAATSTAASGGGFDLMGKIKHIYRYLSKILFFIDAQILWMPFVISAAKKKIKKDGLDVIVSMSQPNSLILTCYRLSKQTGVPLILDMRDPWTNDPYFKPPTKFHLKRYRKIERKALLHAKSVVVISESMKEAIGKTHPMVKDKVIVLPNGFDSEDIAKTGEAVINEKYTITYTGSLYVHHEPALRLFIEGLEAALRIDPSLRDKILVRFVGNVEFSNRTIIEKSSIADLIHLTGYVKHIEAIKYTVQTDALFLFIKLDLDRSKDTITIPGKFFEYLGSRKPIIFLGPRSEVSDILEETGQGWCPTLEPETIGENIVDMVNSKGNFKVDDEKISKYDRKHQASVFADIIKKVKKEN